MGPGKTVRILVPACMLLIAGMLAGCDESQFNTGGQSELDAPAGYVSVNRMATELGMQVESVSPESANLSDGHNSIMLLVGHAGDTYINGKLLSTSGSIVERDGMVFVPAHLISRACAAMTVSEEPSLWDRQVYASASSHTSPRVSFSTASSFGVVVLDPGHGGKDTGAIGIGGVREKDLNLAVALKVRKLLQSRGVDVRMTRSGDKFVSLNGRVGFAARVGADLFVSIHADAARRRSARGYTVYVPRARRTQAKTLATGMLRQMGNTGLPSRGIRPANFRVLANTTCPAVLLEMGYLTNRSDVRRLQGRQFQNSCANAVADSIFACLTRG